MDFSGAIDETDDGDYLAVVIGDVNIIKKNYKILPVGFTHVASIHYNAYKKKEIINKLIFADRNILVYCLKFGLPTVLNLIKQMRSSRLGRLPENKINGKISYIFIDILRTLYLPFLQSRRYTIYDIDFEVDNNIIRRYLTDGGLRTIGPSSTHAIADCVAYANHKRWKVNGNVIEKTEKFKNDFFSAVKQELEDLV